MALAFENPARAWEPYEPDPEHPWDLRRAGHLYRRAAFGATREELWRAVREGPRRTLDRLLQPAGDVQAFNRTHDDLEKTAAKSQDAAPLRAWWLRRMLTTPHPLVEKMTLFWHGHFAVSNARVKNARLMRDHVAKLRGGALGSFRSLLEEMVRDPAVLLGLGAKAGRKAAPGEDFARVVLEDFTLGPGTCTDRDVRESARAFTGRFVLRGKLRTFPREHDSGVKEILGRRGAFRAEDVVEIAVDHAATSRWIVRKLYRWLVSEIETPGEDALLAPLAASFARDHDLAGLVERMLRSKIFFSATAYRCRVKCPVEFALGIVKACGGMVSTTRLARDLATLGKNIFHPPTVKGWAGGRHWINGGTWTGRSNLALALLRGSGPYGNPLDPAALAGKYGHAEPMQAGRFLLDLFLQGDVNSEAKVSLLGVLQGPGRDPGTAIRRFAHAVVTLPEFHLA